MKFTACQIGELAARYGEQRLENYLQTFKCPLNPEVETFLWNKAMSSSRLSSSQTYLVVNEDERYIAGYYTLVLKAYTVNGSLLNSKNRRLISRFAEEDVDGNFHAAVYLVAQIGKNFAVAQKREAFRREPEVEDLARRARKRARQPTPNNIRNQAYGSFTRVRCLRLFRADVLNRSLHLPAKAPRSYRERVG